MDATRSPDFYHPVRLWNRRGSSRDGDGGIRGRGSDDAHRRHHRHRSHHDNGGPSRHRKGQSLPPLDTSQRSRLGQMAPDPSTRGRWLHGAEAAIGAAAAEMWLQRKQSGPWTGSKGVRVATAAAGAGLIETAASRCRSNEARNDAGKGGHSELAIVVGSSIGGLLVNRVLNRPTRAGR